MTWKDKLSDALSTVGAKTAVKAVELAQKRGAEIEAEQKQQKHPRVESPDDLTVHFGISEGTRTFLHLIKNHPDESLVPQKLKDVIGPWLEKYDKAYQHYLSDRFGPEILPLSALISEAIILAQAKALHAAYPVEPFKTDESQEISDLEKHFNTKAEDE